MTRIVIDYVLIDCCLSPEGFIIPQRVVLSIMGFLAIVNAYTMRICLNVAITEMVVKKQRVQRNGSDELCGVDEEGSDLGGGDFEWSEQLQGIILSAFFWGYVSDFILPNSLRKCFDNKQTHFRSLPTFPVESYRRSSEVNTRSAWEFYRRRFSQSSRQSSSIGVSE